MDQSIGDIILMGLHWDTMLLVFLGSVGGMLIGILPGLTATMGIALLVSLTYGLSVVNAFAIMIGLWIGSIFGASRSAILINIPGTPASIATSFDGYPLSKEGHAGHAIGLATVASFAGNLIGVVVLAIAIFPMLEFALRFGSFEFFLLAFVGLTMISSISPGSFIKGLLSGSLGFLVAMVGIDPMTGVLRFTYGSVSLTTGVSFIPVMIGLFGISEVLISIGEKYPKLIAEKIGRVIPSFSTIKKHSWLMAETGLLGTIIGALPGVGGEVACLMGYDYAKRRVKHPTRPFGKGADEGIIAPETANNAAIGGAIIPMLTLGIPGDAVTAVLLGAFIIHGMQPGPLLLVYHKEFFYLIITFIFLAGIFMLVFGLSTVRLLSKISVIPEYILMPIIVVLCVIGSFALQCSFADVHIAFAFGILGYLLRRFGFPLGPLVIGIILGPIADSNLRRSVMLGGGNFFTELLGRPISVVLLIVLILSILSTSAKSKKLFRKAWSLFKGIKVYLRKE